MPRRFDVFDYEIPTGMNLARGSGVRIPFRFGEMRGIVARVTDGAGRGKTIKPVSAILPDLSMTDDELSCFEDVAFDTAQSVSAVLHATIPIPGKRDVSSARRSLSVPPPHREEGSGVVVSPLTISAREAPQISQIVAELSERSEAFVAIPDLKRAAVLIATYRRDHPTEPVLVLAPNVRDARLIASRLSYVSPPHREEGSGVVVVTGEESPAERFRRWKLWRGRRTGLLVGSRVAALWTHPTLGAVFLVRSGHPNHKQDDRNPRFDARFVGQVLHGRLSAKRFHLDVMPSTEDLVGFGAANLLGPTARPETIIADMTIERAGSPHPCLGNSLVIEIAQTLAENRRVICAYNLKGVSRRLQCADCGHRFPCENCGGVLAPYVTTVQCHRCGRTEPLPASCPACHKNKLTPKGFGNRAVAAALQSAFPEATVACLDRDTDVDGAKDADILVVTRHYVENVFDPFHPPDVGLVAELDGDRSLFEPSYRALEKSLLNAEEWRGIAHACRAKFLIQTEMPDLFRNALSQPEKALLDDLAIRKSYAQPPYVRAMTVEFKPDEPGEQAQGIAKAIEAIRAVSTSTEISKLPSPSKGEGQGEVYARIRLAVPPSDELAVLQAFSPFDDSYIIDTRPLE